MNFLEWLPSPGQFQEELKSAGQGPESLLKLYRLSNQNLDFVQTLNLDRRLQKIVSQVASGTELPFPSIRVALLSSSTADHLLPSIRVGALRRGLIVDCYLAPYNQYRQEILDSKSALYAFRPDVIVLALNGEQLGMPSVSSLSAAESDAWVQSHLKDFMKLWKILSQHTSATLIQTTLVVPPPQLFGQLDALMPSAPSSLVTQLNQELKKSAPAHSISLLDIDYLASYIGKKRWCDLPLWHHAKQDVPPLYAPLWGDYLARILAAVHGLSKKCLVLDLDNTIWGGVIGDDGLEGIELGQGTALGEAFQSFQTYVKQLKERGVILAVCSKNEESAGRLPFLKHPEMILRENDIAVFIANWDDKATNLRRIAAQLQIGLDALVFFDDNPAERAYVRQALPFVSVPEVPEDPAWYISSLSEAGYFEAISFTQDDRDRAVQYQANSARSQMLVNAGGDLESFWKELDMSLVVSTFDDVSIPRVAQLINKSNQFNLTTRRYTETQVRQLSNDGRHLTFQFRLKDRLGDNGLISVVIAKRDTDGVEALFLDTWLMSCRVLGRQVETEVLNILTEHARNEGYKALIGEYIATAKNELVRDHYKRLGFSKISETVDGGPVLWRLELRDYSKHRTFIKTEFVNVVTR